MAKKRNSVLMGVELLFTEDGKKLIGWKFKATNTQGHQILEKLLNGEISGLEHCQNKVVRPIAGGAGEYWIAFPK
ncbi:MAG: hypothetical protein HYW69_01860 [Candidatus Nealsonbacteria bacterium]|nr:hypothetical protein [Candidatus Nealsonbacteria bacterium]